jgi:folate-binding protein YgfZ
MVTTSGRRADAAGGGRRGLPAAIRSRASPCSRRDAHRQTGRGTVLLECRIAFRHRSAMPVPLCPAELLALAGADAVRFAHAQFTNDVNALAAGAWQWNAWLDAQGRARAFFALLRVAPDELLAWLPLGGAQAMRDALARYVLRAQVKLEAKTWTLHAAEAGERAPAPAAFHIEMLAGGLALALPGTPPRVALLRPASPADTGADDDALARWRRADVEAGLPLLAPELGGEFVPQALDLERIEAIRFDKGCYPGQEIAARLHFRGGNKRHLRRVRIDGAPPPCGAAVLDAEGAPAGRLLYAAPVAESASVGLAVLAEPALDGRALDAQGSKMYLDKNTQ